MTTVKFEIQNLDGWVEIADENDDTVLIENQSTISMFIAFDITAPVDDVDPGHKLLPGKIMRRLVPGKVWAFSLTDNPTATIVVSTVTDLVLNGDFAADTNWTKGTGWTIASGVAACSGAQGADSDLKETVFTLPSLGTKVKITYTIATRTAGAIAVFAGTAGGISRNEVGTYTEILTVTGTKQLILRADIDFTGTIDNIKVNLV